jgi:hypothetical protein
MNSQPGTGPGSRYAVGVDRGPGSGQQPAQSMQSMSSMFGPATMQNFMNRMPQQGGGSQAGTNQFQQWMQQTPMAYGGQNQGQQQHPFVSQMFGQSGSNGGIGGVRAGDYISEAFARDFANQDWFRNQQNNALQGFIGNLQQVPQMGMMGVDMAQRDGQQGMNLAREGLDRMMRQSNDANKVARRTRSQTQGAMNSAQSGMQSGIDEMDGAIKGHDFFRKETVSSGINAIQSQFQQAKDQIMSNSSMSDEDKQVEIDRLNSTMRQQASSYASQADQQASESLLQAKNVLAGMKMNMGSTMGGLGLQAANINSSTGLQAAGMNLQAAQAGYQLMNAQSQFAASLTQSAMAQAMQAALSGNMAGAQLRMQIGSPLNMADTILAMMNAQGARPGTQTSSAFGGRVGSLIGQSNFGGYAGNSAPANSGFQMPRTTI